MVSRPVNTVSQKNPRRHHLPTGISVIRDYAIFVFASSANVANPSASFTSHFSKHFTVHINTGLALSHT